MTAKGQFYIIASVFVLISLTVLFVFTLFVDFGAFTLPTQSTDFDNLQNSVQQQNTWLQANWYGLSWKNKTVVNITSVPGNPVEIDASINTGNCYSGVWVFNKSGTIFSYVASNVTSSSAPCNVTFNAAVGVYDIYWNCPTCFASPVGRNTISDVGTEISPAKYIMALPSDVCSHFAQILPKKNIALACSAAALSNTYNYSISFRATDFVYSGYLT